MKFKIALFFALFVLVLSFLFYYRSHQSLAGRVIFPISEESPGNIYTMAIDPEIKVLNKAKALVGVRNPTKEKKGYKLYVYAVKEGVVKESSEFSFSLKEGAGTTVSLEFIPDTIGEYEILAKLYDKDEMILLDIKTLKTTSVSDVGPFDLSLDAITKKIGPNEALPIILRMLNTGKKGNEVKIKVKMYCIDKTTKEELFIFLKPNVETIQSVSLLTCDETGPKTVTAELELFNITFVTSSSQVFLGTPYSMKIKVPSIIEIKQGQSVIFSIRAENAEDKAINNLQLGVEDIPMEWQSIEPSTIVTVKPNETAIFMLNLSIPEDTDIGEYPIKIDVGGEEAFASEMATLKVIGVEEKEKEEKKPAELKIVKNKNLIFFMIIGVIIFFGIARIFAVRRRALGEIYKKKVAILDTLKR